MVRPIHSLKSGVCQLSFLFRLQVLKYLDYLVSFTLNNITLLLLSFLVVTYYLVVFLIETQNNAILYFRLEQTSAPSICQISKIRTCSCSRSSKVIDLGANRKRIMYFPISH